MATLEHRDIAAGERHAPHQWAYADATARLAATGFVAGDVYKVALQLSDATLWILTDDSPITWAQVGDGVGYAPGGTDVAVADGGTGASNAATARTNLGLGTAATHDHADYAAASHAHAAADITSGTIAQARLGSGSGGAGTKFLADDQTYKTVTSGGGDVAGDTHAATSKATPVDADELPLVDSAASNALKKLTWANLKATAKTYFDTLYAAVTHTHAASDVTSGTVATARLGSGTADATTFLRGDNTWAVPSGGGGGLTDPQTTAGDMIYRNGSNVTSRLPVGSSGQVLTVSGGVPAWAAAGAGGDSFRDTTKYRIKDDFQTSLQSNGNIGELGWGTFGNGGVSQPATVADHPGLFQITSGGSANNHEMLYLGIGQNIILPSATFDLVWVLRLNTNDSNAICRAGLVDASFSLTPSSWIGIEKVAADTSWFGVARSGGSQTRTAALTATSTNFIVLRVRRVDASTIGFSAGATFATLGTEATVTATIPTGVLSPFMQVGTAAAASKTADADYFDLQITGLTR